ncbi:hypothetical protein [Saccharopolyspora phatthalungensis]|uniref:Uncharacterized protein n=1 Tax=Saccharopolyspora phatthalungensis TaxID=664693 RepID=A0A840QFV8_9PSEU|nr:hypothetical protein [Saccharopolyspora phatthalungensis]MBB5157489.1 hypothetical protein [Saccharopolyspora phatthalungensis]
MSTAATAGGSSSSAGARGGASGVAAGVGAAGRGQREDDDKGHTNKYAEPTKDA